MKRLLHIMAVLMTACGGGTNGVCEPGETQVCLCLDGTTGVQVCEEDGGGWSHCPCGDAGTVGDASGEGCSSDGECDDSDPCTRDFCDDGWCAHDEVDGDGDGYSPSECGGTDCDDEDAEIFPGAVPGCSEGEDRDCDTVEDRDEDGDGYVAEGCGGDDCDDEDATTFVGSTDRGCEGEDHDCNGVEDADNDEDGRMRVACGGNDCDDDDDTVYWGAAEIECDGKDNDCNGVLHATEDADRDGFANDACGTGETDCDDSVPWVYPGAPERCDMVDDDCDGSWAGGGADDDGDDHLDEACGGDDCDDTRADVYLDAPEVCEDWVDQDCDGIADGAHALMDAVRVSDVDGHAFHPTMQWTGSLYGLAWSDLSMSGSTIRFRLVSESGSPLGTTSVIDTGYLHAHPTIAWSGSEFGISWLDDWDFRRDIYCTRVATDGTAAGSTVRVTDDPAHSDAPSLAWTGSEYGLSWQEEADGNEEIYFARISASGTVTGTAVRVTSDTASSTTPSLAWAGSMYGLAWSDDRDGNGEIYFARLSSAGASIGTHVRISTAAGGSEEPALAWTGSAFGLAWQDETSGYFEIHFVGIDSAGAMTGTEQRITTSPHRSIRPSLIWKASEFALAWLDNRDGPYEVYFTRISPAGIEQRDDERVTTDGAFNLGGPELAWTGSEYAVAFLRQPFTYQNLEFLRFGLCE